MKIKVLTTFLEGRDRFEKDDERTVSDEDGARFVENGWARDLAGVAQAGEPASGDLSLDIHDSTIGQEARHG